MPWIDIRADIDAINAGEGFHDRGTRQTWVNGRVYGMHGDGRTYPISGVGIINVSRGAYNALLIFRQYNGIDERAEFRISRERSIKAADRLEAIRIWRLREEAISDNNRDHRN